VDRIQNAGDQLKKSFLQPRKHRRLRPRVQWAVAFEDRLSRRLYGMNAHLAAARSAAEDSLSGLRVVGAKLDLVAEAGAYLAPHIDSCRISSGCLGGWGAEGQAGPRRRGRLQRPEGPSACLKPSMSEPGVLSAQHFGGTRAAREPHESLQYPTREAHLGPICTIRISSWLRPCLC
jgi:hypothetical protein